MSVAFPKSGHNTLYSVEDKSFWYQHRNLMLKELLQKYPPPKWDFVEIGGGNGFVSHFIQDLGYEVTMFEPVESGVANSQQRGIARIHQSAFDASLLSKPASAVGLFDVIEHIEDDGALLSEIYGSLSKHGKLYITAPAYPVLWSGNDNCGHYRRYTEKSLLSVVESAGFTVLYSTYFFWALPGPIFLLRSIPYRLKGGKVIPGAADATWEGLENRHLTNLPLWLRSLALKLFSFEHTRIPFGKKGKFGSSIFVVATKARGPDIESPGNGIIIA